MRRKFLALGVGLAGSALCRPASATVGRPQGTQITQLFAGLDAHCEQLSQSTVLQAEWRALRQRRGVTELEMPLLDFVRVRTMFEATRSGGLWRLRWDITHQKPNSTRIWTQWQRLRHADPLARPDASAVAECDELSALLAYCCRQLGVRGIGLFLAGMEPRRRSLGAAREPTPPPTGSNRDPHLADHATDPFRIGRHSFRRVYPKNYLRISTG